MLIVSSIHGPVVYCDGNLVWLLVVGARSLRMIVRLCRSSVVARPGYLC